MRLCFIVDYRSAIARNWIAHFVARGDEAHVISTYPCDGPAEGLASLTVEPLGLYAATGRAGLRRYFAATPGQRAGGSVAPGRSSRLISTTRRVGARAMRLHSALLPLALPLHAPRVRARIARIAPDLVHAMRIPFEAMLAAEALRGLDIPLVASVWGNDFTLFARQFRLIGRATRRCLPRVDALHADCARDARLALEWGFDARRPRVVLPGSGGVQAELFHARERGAARRRWDIPADRLVIFNPRSIRPEYVRTDTFFASMERVLRARADAMVVCVGMAGVPEAERWRARLPDPAAVRLLPAVKREQMAELFRAADVSVSPSLHDGTPNTLLEAMACGALPVAGDIESIREWIVDGENGLLCDPTSIASVADAVLRGIDDRTLRQRAAARNAALIAERADYPRVMARAEALYDQVVGSPAGAGVRVPALQPR